MGFESFHPFMVARSTRSTKWSALNKRRLRKLVQFVNDAIGPFVRRLREQPGKDIWLMGGGEIIASFLDEQTIDEFVISVAPVFIGEGIPLIARRPRHVPLELLSIERFEDGLVQLHYRVQNAQS